MTLHRPCPAFRHALLAAVLAVAVLAGAPSFAQDKYPSKKLDWTIAFGPGGGNDIMTRTIISILEKYKLYPDKIIPENRAGGSGAKGWGYVFSQKGNPYHITSTSGSLITTPLQANTGWTATSFTPIALLASDDAVILVNGKSKIRTFQEFVAQAKAKPPAIGGIGTVNVEFIVPKLLSERGDKLIDQVPFAAHDFHAVVSGVAGQGGTGAEIVDGSLHQSAAHFPGFEW